MNFTESLVKFTIDFEKSNYDVSCLQKILESLDQGHRFVKDYVTDIVLLEKIKKNPIFNSYLKENKRGWLVSHNFPITFEILNKQAVPGKLVSVKSMKGQSRTLVIYYAICPELENFVNIVNWVDSQSSKNSWIQIRNLIKEESDQVLEFSKACGIRLPNKIHPGFNKNPKLVKKEILRSLYDWRKSFFLFDDGFTFYAHNSPTNFRKIFFGLEKETALVDIRTMIGKFEEKSVNGFKILIPTLFGDPELHDLINSDKDFPNSKISSKKLYRFLIFHKSGEKNIENHIIKIEEANAKDLLGMFHAVSCYLLYLGDKQLKILNIESFQKLFSHLFNQVSKFLNENNLESKNLEEIDWKNIQNDFTSTMTRWIHDLYYIPPLLRKTFDEYQNPLFRDVIVQEFDQALSKNKSICFENILFNDQGNRWFTRQTMGKLNRIYSLIHFLLEEKRLLFGFNRYFMNNREKEYTMLKNFLSS